MVEAKLLLLTMDDVISNVNARNVIPNIVLQQYNGNLINAKTNAYFLCTNFLIVLVSFPVSILSPDGLA